MAQPMKCYPKLGQEAGVCPDICNRQCWLLPWHLECTYVLQEFLKPAKRKVISFCCVLPPTFTHRLGNPCGDSSFHPSPQPIVVLLPPRMHLHGCMWHTASSGVRPCRIYPLNPTAFLQTHLASLAGTTRADTKITGCLSGMQNVDLVPQYKSQHDNKAG